MRAQLEAVAHPVGEQRPDREERRHDRGAGRPGAGRDRSGQERLDPAQLGRLQQLRVEVGLAFRLDPVLRHGKVLGPRDVADLAAAPVVHGLGQRRGQLGPRGAAPAQDRQLGLTVHVGAEAGEARPGHCPAEITLLNQHGPTAAERQLAGDRGADNAAADNRYVEGHAVARQRAGAARQNEASIRSSVMTLPLSRKSWSLANESMASCKEPHTVGTWASSAGGRTGSSTRRMTAARASRPSTTRPAGR